MAKHKNYIENFDGEMTDLVVEIGNMTHEARQEFFAEFANYVHNQAKSDEKVNRFKYAKLLSEIAIKLSEIQDLESKCWEICEPYTVVVNKDDK